MKLSQWFKSFFQNQPTASQEPVVTAAPTTSTQSDVIESQQFENILVAKVTQIEKHPNADRLRVITLTDGLLNYGPIVCGAWNFDVGAIVPLALPGATIPHDQHDPEGKPFVLSKAKIRGIESQGMICSGKELGLTDDGKGILILDPATPVGGIFSADLVKS
jgi:phenylalanyl-tRNA synthetase beta chain